MSTYLLIETRTARDGQEVLDFLDMAKALATSNNVVDLFLIQNAVLMARTDAEQRIAELLASPLGINVWVDEFSLASRSLDAAHLLAGIKVGTMQHLVRALVQPGCKPIWH